MFLGEAFQGFLEQFFKASWSSLRLFKVLELMSCFCLIRQAIMIRVASGQDFILRCEIFLAFGRVGVRFPVLDEQIVRGVQNFLSCGIMGAFLSKR